MSKRSVLFLFVLLEGVFVKAQLSNKTNFVDSKIKTDILNVPLDTTTYYFPIQLLIHPSSKSHKVDAFLENWFSGMLFAMHEPLLYNKIEEKQVYRFTWLRSFRNPIAIRIENFNGKISLFIKETDGLGGYNPGKIDLNEQKELTLDQWTHFIKLLSRIDYWHIPVMSDDMGADGAEWILEGSSKDSYHLAIRWSPEKSDFSACCDYLISLSGLKISKEDMY